MAHSGKVTPGAEPGKKRISKQFAFPLQNSFHHIPKDITWLKDLNQLRNQGLFEGTPEGPCKAAKSPPPASIAPVRAIPFFHPEMQFGLKEHLIATFSTKPGTVKRQIRAEHKQTPCSRKREDRANYPQFTDRGRGCGGTGLPSGPVNWAN